MKAILYVRVSSQEQQEGYSLDAQERLGKEYAQKHGFEIVKTWRVWESAWKEDRKAFTEMLEFSKRNKGVKVILFDCVDRMTRNSVDGFKIEQIVKQHDKEVHFFRTGRKLTQTSRSDDFFTMDVDVIVAKRTSSITSEKARDGMTEKARQGHWPTSAPFGYLNNPATKLIEIDQKRAAFIQKLFELYATGRYSLRTLEDKIFQEGFRTARGAKISDSLIDKILKNPIYSGPFYWKGVLITNYKHAPIIPRELFEAVKAITKRNQKPYETKREFAFAGLIRCEKCGGAITSEIKKGRYVYYHCTKLGCGNFKPFLREEYLDAAFEKKITALQIPEDKVEWFKEALLAKHEEAQEYRKAKFLNLNQRTALLESQIQKMYEDKLEGKIDEGFWQKNHNKKQEELLNLKAELTEVKELSKESYLMGVKFIELFQRIHSVYVTKSLEEKRKFLKILVSNSTLNDATLCVKYRKPFDLLAEGLLCREKLREAYPRTTVF